MEQIGDLSEMYVIAMEGLHHIDVYFSLLQFLYIQYTHC